MSVTAPVTLWHYTCDHGRAGLGDAGTLLAVLGIMPDRVQASTLPVPMLSTVWCTDLDAPHGAVLGLARHPDSMVTCDRTAHRYRVTDPTALTWWLNARRTWRPDLRYMLEAAPGVMPAHWWVADSGVVPVVYDPL